MTPQSAQRVLQALRFALGEALDRFLADADITEIMVNPDGRIWTESVARGRAASEASLSPIQVENSLRLLANIEHQVLNSSNPRISGQIPVLQYRFQGAVPPVSASPILVIRKPKLGLSSLEAWLDIGSINPRQKHILEHSLRERLNIIVAGGTSSGKTTLANALLNDPFVTTDRIAILEDTPELTCEAPDQVRLRTRASNPVVTLGDLVHDCLRLRPDRIIVGEVRDGAALDLLKAWNTGHPGGVTTLHANSAVDALVRLEELAQERTPTAPRRLIGRTVDLIVYIRRGPLGRRIEQMARVEGWAAGGYRISNPELTNP